MTGRGKLTLPELPPLGCVLQSMTKRITAATLAHPYPWATSLWTIVRSPTRAPDVRGARLVNVIEALFDWFAQKGPADGLWNVGWKQKHEFDGRVAVVFNED